MALFFLFNVCIFFILIAKSREFVKFETDYSDAETSDLDTRIILKSIISRCNFNGNCSKGKIYLDQRNYLYGPSNENLLPSDLNHCNYFVRKNIISSMSLVCVLKLRNFPLPNPINCVDPPPIKSYSLPSQFRCSVDYGCCQLDCCQKGTLNLKTWIVWIIIFGTILTIICLCGCSMSKLCNPPFSPVLNGSENTDDHGIPLTRLPTYQEATVQGIGTPISSSSSSNPIDALPIINTTCSSKSPRVLADDQLPPTYSELF